MKKNYLLLRPKQHVCGVIWAWFCPHHPSCWVFCRYTVQSTYMYMNKKHQLVSKI